jgi:hypothetical protein
MPHRFPWVGHHPTTELPKDTHEPTKGFPAITDTWRCAQALQDEMVRLPRAIHQYPELGFEEFKTSDLVTETLQSLGIRPRAGVGKTGVVGYLAEVSLRSVSAPI